ncbi:hypothetical protein QYE76_039882 [Lolium multiflorum]|uniref:Uncharacterized protein n=1 Tax=Lolium multiflorum TaxID=4521 RepID=A0AAD8TC11_LOLMU|nr:hypothetical protein QYE76_039882 [Lolium multiflorum]
MRLVLLFNLVQGIEPGTLESFPNSPIPHAGHRLSSLIPATLVLLRPNRAHLHLAGNVVHPLDLFVFFLFPSLGVDRRVSPQVLVAGKLSVMLRLHKHHVLVHQVPPHRAHPRARFVSSVPVLRVDLLPRHGRFPSQISDTTWFKRSCDQILEEAINQTLFASPPDPLMAFSPDRSGATTGPWPSLPARRSLIRRCASQIRPRTAQPMIKELRIGAQFVGYRDYASKTEEKLAEANERADALAQKLEQSEEARKNAESDAVQARREADKAKADAASVGDLRKRLHAAETSLSEHITAQSAREEAITKRIRTQNRRFVTREGIDEARTGLSRLFPYFFPKKEEPATFLTLAKCFNPPEDLGLKMRHENMKVAVESTVALVADSQQTIDWAKVGNTEQIEQAKWRSLIKAAKLNTKKILAYLGIKPSSTPSSSKPEV